MSDDTHKIAWFDQNIEIWDRFSHPVPDKPKAPSEILDEIMNLQINVEKTLLYIIDVNGDIHALIYENHMRGNPVAVNLIPLGGLRGEWTYKRARERLLKADYVLIQEQKYNYFDLFYKYRKQIKEFFYENIDKFTLVKTFKVYEGYTMHLYKKSEVNKS